MWKRIAKAVAGQEKKEDGKKWEKEFYEAMKDFKYIPGDVFWRGPELDLT